ncbi:MAG: hypothetical protein J7L51_04580 [Desulfurococcales archaeon]|nr:hypothetical protein [Desulfurococcales archaeon]
MKVGKMGKSPNWIQKAIKRPGRVKRYLKMKYGNKAFTKTGEVKQTYVYKAIKELKQRPPSKRPPGLLNALYLAIRLEKFRKK